MISRRMVLAGLEGTALGALGVGFVKAVQPPEAVALPVHRASLKPSLAPLEPRSDLTAPPRNAEPARPAPTQPERDDALLEPARPDAPKTRGERSISLRQRHTGETVEATYWVDGRYVASECDRLDWLFRDWRRADWYFAIDRKLYDLIWEIQVKRLETSEPLVLISGYRTDETNEEVGGATRSLHMNGKAADIYAPRIPLKTVRKAAVDADLGGIGFYPRSNFVHLDVGPRISALTGNRRIWRG